MDLSEIRPELNHATNSGVIVGRRALSKGRNLDRRSFLVSYDPFLDNERGTSLQRMLTPALIVCSGINLEYLFSTTNADHSAGTKAPLNGNCTQQSSPQYDSNMFDIRNGGVVAVVGGIGVMQGTVGDLRPGLPSQMTEMHTPIRLHYIIDAPVARVEAVLSRDQYLKNLVENEWVKLVVRDPHTNQFWEQREGQYMLVESDETHEAPAHFKRQGVHGVQVAKNEAMMYQAAKIGLMLSFVGPVGLHYDVLGAGGLNSLVASPQGAAIAMAATMASLPSLTFARRYLHGEHMFGRFSGSTVGLLTGFNLVATAPSLDHTLAGWTLFGFSSAFLIGMYNERPSVRQNATFAFGAYRLGDLAMLSAATFAPSAAGVVNASTVDGVCGVTSGAIVAGSLITAAFFKSSQFPLSSLFARSMEGPTPSSALGYAGLSAHIGVVLLATNVELWAGYTWACMVIGGGGALTTVTSSLVAQTCADRKGAIAYATSATLGQIFMVLAMGYTDAALGLSLAHGAYRINQVLMSPNIIMETHARRAALDGDWSAITPPAWLYNTAWRIRRIDKDLLDLLRLPMLSPSKPLNLTKSQQYAATAGIVTAAGFPFTPLSETFEHTFMELLPTHPHLAGAMGVAHCAVSVLSMRFLFSRVLDVERFRNDFDDVSRGGREGADR